MEVVLPGKVKRKRKRNKEERMKVSKEGRNDRHTIERTSLAERKEERIQCDEV